MHHSRTIRGFTLIEVMVYLAVTVLVSLAAVSTYLSLDMVIVRNATERAVNHAAVVTFEHLGRDIRRAVGVNAGLSTFGTESSTLVLDFGTSTATYALSGDTLMLSENGATVGPLTPENVAVEAFTVHHLAGTSTELVRVALTLSGASKAASTTRTYYLSAVLRGTYE